MQRFCSGVAGLLVAVLALTPLAYPQEDKMVQAAIEAARTHMHLPQEAEIKFWGKKASPIPGFYSVRLSLSLPDKEVPMVVYVDKTGEKVILGALIVKGENLTRKEAGDPVLGKVDMRELEMDKSPFRGSTGAKVTVVEFSNFQSDACVKSWKKMKELLSKYPQKIKYVFKHFPLQSEPNGFALSEMVAAAQTVNPVAFWALHDFLFSAEGQGLVKGDKEILKRKITEVLKGKGYDIVAFEAALKTGKGEKRVEEDVALGNKIRVMGPPSVIVNGDFFSGVIQDSTLDRYIGKP